MSKFKGMLKDSAYISPTQRIKALKNSGYGPGGSIHQPRCGNCTHCRPFTGLSGTQHDRDCALFQTTVKSHRVCKRYSKGKANG